MKKVTLTISTYGILPKMGWFGSISFGDERYNAIATEGFSSGEFEVTRNNQGALMINGYALFPINNLNKGVKQMSLGDKWNRSWGLFETNRAWVALQAHIKQVTLANAGEVEQLAKEKIEEFNLTLVEASATVASMVEGEAKDKRLEELAEMAVEVEEDIASLVAAVASYQPTIEAIVK